ncbi:hypothetical protein DUNSADRAFT_546 [Dunaliella salina]|uniref:Encoded protein n=1 Tax=Dunaliella salina TaxID=3046 RepID=A0ABQ7FYR9_DUNSA|nr:hypothetical protein DUNSADRAFT_546 [Dunaliella salina]|eukprot:KAF5827507.1 hypothetical protein DUNSADRAFT_546 [Dunaliella salina]
MDGQGGYSILPTRLPERIRNCKFWKRWKKSAAEADRRVLPLSPPHHHFLKRPLGNLNWLAGLQGNSIIEVRTCAACASRGN